MRSVEGVQYVTVRGEWGLDEPVDKEVNTCFKRDLISFTVSVL